MYEIITLNKQTNKKSHYSILYPIIKAQKLLTEKKKQKT